MSREEIEAQTEKVQSIREKLETAEERLRKAEAKQNAHLRGVFTRMVEALLTELEIEEKTLSSLAGTPQEDDQASETNALAEDNNVDNSDDSGNEMETGHSAGGAQAGFAPNSAPPPPSVPRALPTFGFAQLAPTPQQPPQPQPVQAPPAAPLAPTTGIGSLEQVNWSAAAAAVTPAQQLNKEQAPSSDDEDAEWVAQQAVLAKGRKKLERKRNKDPETPKHKSIGEGHQDLSFVDNKDKRADEDPTRPLGGNSAADAQRAIYELQDERRAHLYTVLDDYTENKKYLAEGKTTQLPSNNSTNGPNVIDPRAKREEEGKKFFFELLEKRVFAPPGDTTSRQTAAGTSNLSADGIYTNALNFFEMWAEEELNNPDGSKDENYLFAEATARAESVKVYWELHHEGGKGNQQKRDAYRETVLPTVKSALIQVPAKWCLTAENAWQKEMAVKSGFSGVLDPSASEVKKWIVWSPHQWCVHLRKRRMDARAMQKFVEETVVEQVSSSQRLETVPQKCWQIIDNVKHIIKVLSQIVMVEKYITPTELESSIHLAYQQMISLVDYCFKPQLAGAVPLATQDDLLYGKVRDMVVWLHTHLSIITEEEKALKKRQQFRREEQVLSSRRDQYQPASSGAIDGNEYQRRPEKDNQRRKRSRSKEKEERLQRQQEIQRQVDIDRQKRKEKERAAGATANSSSVAVPATTKPAPTAVSAPSPAITGAPLATPDEAQRLLKEQIARSSGNTQPIVGANMLFPLNPLPVSAAGGISGAPSSQSLSTMMTSLGSHLPPHLAQLHSLVLNSQTQGGSEGAGASPSASGAVGQVPSSLLSFPKPPVAGGALFNMGPPLGAPPGSASLTTGDGESKEK